MFVQSIDIYGIVRSTFPFFFFRLVEHLVTHSMEGVWMSRIYKKMGSNSRRREKLEKSSVLRFSLMNARALGSQLNKMLPTGAQANKTKSIPKKKKKKCPRV